MRQQRGKGGERRVKKGIDVREWIRDFVMSSEDVDRTGGSYLAHILKLGTPTIYGSVRMGNGGM